MRIAEDEYNLIQNAPQKYGKYYENAKDFVFLSWNFSKKFNKNAWVFIAFVSQIRKSLTLALLSALRKHDTQTCVMLRFVLEFAVLACYSLENKDEETFGKIKSDGFFEINDKV
jgi:hypothetical protein